VALLIEEHHMDLYEWVLMFGIMAYRRVKKEDLKRIAKATGGTVVVTMADMEGNEVFDASLLGKAEEVRDITCTLLAVA